MEKVVIIIVAFLTLNSCQFIGVRKGINFKIENKSNNTLKQITFSTSEMLDVISFDNINPNESVSGFLTMKDNKSDGTYVLEFTQNGKREIKRNGYYTNGIALDHWIEFEIKNDTITSRLGGKNQ